MYYRQKKDLASQLEPRIVNTTLKYPKSVSKQDTVLNCVQVKYNYQDVSSEICKYLDFQNHNFGYYSPTQLYFLVVDI